MRHRLARREPRGGSSGTSTCPTDAHANLGWSLRQVQLALHSTGTTPGQLIRSERLDRARRLLREASADRTVAEIAYASGFRSLSAFGTSFKGQFGLTPHEARSR
ncbi:helix-turn-helix domain-containing protein [Nocardia sp. NPDC052112]|uniref:helix-turn-helix domain-containing protein n=1 Tax=Nocardia sp. NPDC052112 TaxID=3155646 RepID=UPI0034135EC7